MRVRGIPSRIGRYRKVCRQNRQTDRQIGRQAGRETDRQTDKSFVST